MNRHASWLDQLPPHLDEHARTLRLLLALAESDERIRALQVQGSIGRGEGDFRSDLDVGMVVSNAAWPTLIHELPVVVAALGGVVDQHAEPLPPGAVDPQVLRIWTQFTNDIQLDLLVLPEVSLLGSGPDGRTFYDPDGLLLRTDHPMRVADPLLLSKWAFLCWHNLAEVVKNIERDRPVAAAEWLGSARLATISCWAAANDAEYSGLAIVVAARLGISCPWLDGLEQTYPLPERSSVLAAAVALTKLQMRVEALMLERFGVAPRSLAQWVSSRLDRLVAEAARTDSRPAPSSRRGRAKKEARPRPPRRAAPRLR